MNLVIKSKSDFKSLIHALSISLNNSQFNKMKLSTIRKLIAASFGFKTDRRCLNYIETKGPIVVEAEEYYNHLLAEIISELDCNITVDVWDAILKSFETELFSRCVLSSVRIMVPTNEKYNDRPFFRRSLKNHEISQLKPKSFSFTKQLHEELGENYDNRPKHLYVHIFDDFHIATDRNYKKGNYIGTLSLNPILSYAEISIVITCYSKKIEQIINEFKTHVCNPKPKQLEYPDFVKVNELYPHDEFKYQSSLHSIQAPINEFSYDREVLNVEKFEKFQKKLPPKLQNYAAELYVKSTKTTQYLEAIKQMESEG